jgi:hypothetical protein
MKTDEIRTRLVKLEARNQRVESDKSWETSWIRHGSIMLLTYLVVAFYLRFIVHINPWVNALVPVVGFTLSTLTISFIKNSGLKSANLLGVYSRVYSEISRAERMRPIASAGR